MTRARPARGRLVAACSSAPAGRALARGLARWLERAAPARARGAVGIALVTDTHIRRLNREYRGIDRATDVLSFPWARDQGRNESSNSLHVNYLGDIAIAIGVAGRQARAEGHAPRVEVRILALHGLLHLLGYDHERDQGAMRRVEERLRRRAGLPRGLILRASPRPAGS